jgi:hypothetical protein
MTIKFITDNSINYKGFIAEYGVQDQSEFQYFFLNKFFSKEIL